MATLIVAHDHNRCIGKDGTIPWHLPEDMKLFKARTTGHTVVMGRRTWDSLPPKFKPLPHRCNLIISSKAADLEREWGPTILGPFFLSDIKSAVDFHRSFPIGDLIIIGGAQIYAEALHLGIVNKMYVSIVKTPVQDGDVFFPPINHNWAISKSIDYQGFTDVEMVKNIG